MLDLITYDKNAKGIEGNSQFLLLCKNHYFFKVHAFGHLLTFQASLSVEFFPCYPLSLVSQPFCFPFTLSSTYKLAPISSIIKKNFLLSLLVLPHFLAVLFCKHQKRCRPTPSLHLHPVASPLQSDCKIHPW